MDDIQPAGSGADGNARGASARPATVTTTSTTTTTKRSGSIFVRRRSAWAPWKIGLLGVGALALVGGIGTAVSVGRIQDDLESGTKADLAAAGIDLGDLDVDASYRNVTLSGVLPSGVTEAQVRSAVDVDGIRDLDLDLTSPSGAGDDTDGASTPTTEAETEATTAATAEAEPSTTEAAVETGPTEVVATSAKGTITLTGTVLTEGHRTTLVDAAADAVGADNVVDELEVSGLDEATPGADDRIAGLAAVLGGLESTDAVEATLTDTELTVTGSSGDQAGADAINDAVAAAAADAGIDGTGDVAPSASEAPDTGATEATATFDGTKITLTGTVLTDEQRQTLIDAAVAAVGADNVVDELTVSGLDEATPGGDGRVSDLAALLAGFPGMTEATASLTDTGLTLTGTAKDQQGSDAITGIVGELGAVPTTADIGIDAGSAGTIGAETTALQAELDALTDEISATVRFDTASGKLTPGARATLDKVVAAMESYPRPVVEITGHTDDRGTDSANQALSERRAEEVLFYLASQGIDPARLQATGKGESEPIADNTTDAGRAENRRVEFTARPSF